MGHAGHKRHVFNTSGERAVQSTSGHIPCSGNNSERPLTAERVSGFTWADTDSGSKIYRNELSVFFFFDDNGSSQQCSYFETFRILQISLRNGENHSNDCENFDKFHCHVKTL